MAGLHTVSKPYEPPSWAGALKPVPKARIHLGHFPTPCHRWRLPRVPDEVEVFIKRDDLSGMQLSGNKVRKLEFLLAQALEEGCDTAVTIGGIQSNHCRATAVAARYVGLGAHLILRNSRAAADQDPGLVGNLLVERLVGAHISQVTKEEYTQHGSESLLTRLCSQLKSEGRKPFPIPVGGSDALGTWGYLEFARELSEQTSGLQGVTDVVLACGSGGTAAGVALGLRLLGSEARVHAYGVCDDPGYFYRHCQGILDGMGATQEALGATASDLFEARQAKGLGYAMSTDEELVFVQEIAEQTGVILDPVYSGKAAFGFVRDVASDLESWKGRRVIFLHTGGLLGMYEKQDQLMSLMDTSKVTRMQL